MIHSIGPINVCTDLRSIGTKLTNLESMEKSYIYLTSRDAKSVRRTSWGLRDNSDMYFDQEDFETNHKPLRLPVLKLWLK